MSKKEARKQRVLKKHREILKQSNISLWLDSYNDIFSDFDSRPYSQRALSDDFLIESKRASRDKVSGKIELNLLIPKGKRDPQIDILIKRRLRAHFNRHYSIMLKEKRKIINQSTVFISVSIILMFITTFILTGYPKENKIFTFISVLLEPAGWFLFWEGLNISLFEKKKVLPELNFYKKMASCEVKFFSY